MTAQQVSGRSDSSDKEFAYLELHPGLHFLSQHLRNGLVKIGHDAHRELRLYSSTADKIVESICEGKPNAEQVS